MMPRWQITAGEKGITALSLGKAATNHSSRRGRDVRAARAVGNALAHNPLPIIIPCHRVVRADGTFAAFVLGRGWKKRLLGLEKSFAKTKASQENRARRPGPQKVLF